MADTKITALTALTAADPANDVIPIVDVSDTTMAASGTTKKISVNNILSSSPTATGAFTVTGLVTAGSATITGAATVGTTLEVTGNLTASSNIYVPASTTFKVGPVAGTWAGLRFDAAKAMFLDSDTTITFRVNGGTSFSTAGSIDTSGNLNLNTGNVVMATSGKGIDFSATANSSGTMTSELLNDYEEGTTSTITIATQTSGTITLNGSFNTLSYTKIGRLVTVTGNLLVSSVSLPVGVYIDVNGLPFARNGSRNTDTSPSISVISAVSSGATTFYGYIPTGATSTLRIIGDATQYQANTEIMISLQYFV